MNTKIEQKIWLKKEKKRGKNSGKTAGIAIKAFF